MSNVTSDGSTTLAAAVVPLRVLKGDVTGDGTVAAGDVFVTKSYSSETTNGANFRADINLDGVVAAGDVFLVKAAASVASVSGGPTANTAPTIGTVVDQAANAGQASTPVGFTVGDAESDPNSLYVWGTSSNTTILPNSGITIGGGGTGRTVILTPATGQTGSCVVTLSVSGRPADHVHDFQRHCIAPLDTLLSDDGTRRQHRHHLRHRQRDHAVERRQHVRHPSIPAIEPDHRRRSPSTSTWVLAGSTGRSSSTSTRPPRRGTGLTSGFSARPATSRPRTR